MPFYIVSLVLTIVLIIHAGTFPKEYSIALIKNPNVNLRNHEEIDKLLGKVASSVGAATGFMKNDNDADDEDDEFDVNQFNHFR